MRLTTKGLVALVACGVLCAVMTPHVTYGQNIYLNEFDGDDWREWDERRQVIFLHGFMLANWAAGDLLWELHNLPDDVRHIRSLLNNMRYYDTTDMLHELDRFYEDPRDRSVPIYVAMYLVSGKAPREYDRRRSPRGL